MNFDKNNASENFDKEFSLNKKQNGTGTRGKLPSWIMILAGAAMITGVVVAKQPVLRPVEISARSAVNVPAGNEITVDTGSVIVGNDIKADPSELDGRLGSQAVYRPSDEDHDPVIYAANDQSYNMELQALGLDENGYVVPPEVQQKDSSVLWIGDKPYALTLQPAAGAETGDEISPAKSSVYWLDGKAYQVTMKTVDPEEAASMQDSDKAGLVKAGDQICRIQIELIDQPDTESKSAVLQPGGDMPEDKVEPADNTSEKSAVAPEDNASAAKSVEQGESQPDMDPSQTAKADAPAVAWAGGKPYSVLVQPWQESPESEAETTSAQAEETRQDVVMPVANTAPEKQSDNSPVSLPVQIITDDDKAADKSGKTDKPQKSVVFEVEGNPYEILVSEISPEDAPEKTGNENVVWIDTTPLQVSLKVDPVSSENGDAQADAEAFEIILNPVAEEKVPALFEAHFGKPYETETPEAAEEPVITAEPETTPEPEEVQEENWFVNMFHSIFGSSPTEVPTPQVTVIPPTPTPTVPRPTQTPIVVRLQPTAAVAEGPVRLDADGTPVPQKPTPKIPTAKPADVDNETLSEAKDPAGKIADQSETKTGTAQLKVTIVPDDQEFISNVKPEAADQNPSDSVNVQPTPDELPHTGMADDWNIPSLAALLAGLLMVIIGVRRLRANRR